MKPHTLFVYGTLKRGHGNHPLLERYDSDFVGPATTVEATFLLTETFPMVFRASEPYPPGYAFHVGKILGEVYRVSDEGLKHVDALEGHPTFYTRTPIQVEMGGDPIDAEIYLMVNRGVSRADLARPVNKVLEWGRYRREAARRFQADTGARFKKR